MEWTAFLIALWLLATALGFAFAIRGGEYAVPRFISWCNRNHGLQDRDTSGRASGDFVGKFERTGAFLLVAFFPPEAPAIGLTFWMTAKFLNNWHRGALPGYTEEEWRTRAFIALMAGTLSIGCGVVGGLMSRYSWPFDH